MSYSPFLLSRESAKARPENVRVPSDLIFEWSIVSDDDHSVAKIF